VALFGRVGGAFSSAKPPGGFGGGFERSNYASGETEPPAGGKFVTIMRGASTLGIYYVQIVGSGFTDESFKDPKVIVVENATVNQPRVETRRI